MKDIHTDEQLTFKCRRWLSRDEDDHEICRELPAVRDGEPSLPSKSRAILSARVDGVQGSPADVTVCHLLIVVTDACSAAVRDTRVHR